MGRGGWRKRGGGVGDTGGGRVGEVVNMGIGFNQLLYKKKLERWLKERLV